MKFIQIIIFTFTNISMNNLHLLMSAFAGKDAVSPYTMRDAGTCYFTSLAVIVATWRPWNRAAASSFSLGMRAPVLPAIVEAP